MVVHIALIILLGPSSLLSPVQAIRSDIYGQLIGLVATHLNGSLLDFNTWTKDISSSLSEQEQQRVAWNVPWSDILHRQKSPLYLQSHLNTGNPFKLRLWMSLYWHLRRSHLLNELHLSNFARELRSLKSNHPELWNNNLQNMLQSLPRSLRLLVKTRRLCLEHKKELLYITAGNHLALGANSNCSIWEAEEENRDHWLRLVNVCDDSSPFFISMLSQGATQVLFSAPNDVANAFCVLRGVAYFEKVLNTEGNCHWQLNDCSFLPKILSANNKN
ncbi:uncharacterized protein LOC26526300 [Drosophila erecta]|uniref:Uncharacterized protein n=1 Tax=Drosophila erecta TaxID=7220 RepID=A0A0Q5VZD8_DROER|nr:uncharacterized protein LOC26526300 [Drosophila erecta]KQS62338.1 uncharacterized protein Dere_GG26476 [Drosophila erecta]